MMNVMPGYLNDVSMGTRSYMNRQSSTSNKDSLIMPDSAHLLRKKRPDRGDLYTIFREAELHPWSIQWSILCKMDRVLHRLMVSPFEILWAHSYNGYAKEERYYAKVTPGP